MTYDIATRVSNAQSLASQTSVVSESSIKLTTNGSVYRDIGPGGQLSFTVHVTEAFDADRTLAVEVIVASNDVLTSNVVAIGKSVTVSMNAPSGFTTIVGQQFEVPIPEIPLAVLADGKQFMGLRYTIDSSSATGGVSAWIGLGQSTNSPPRRYAANYTGPTGS